MESGPPTFPDPAGDFLKMTQSELTDMTTSLIGETLFKHMLHVILQISLIGGGEENLPDSRMQMLTTWHIEWFWAIVTCETRELVWILKWE